MSIQESTSRALAQASTPYQQSNARVDVMTRTTHQMYKSSSPYYQGILASEGRYLSPEVVSTILRDHSVEVEEYLSDPYVALGALPERTDAADLLAFLGY